MLVAQMPNSYSSVTDFTIKSSKGISGLLPPGLLRRFGLVFSNNQDEWDPLYH